MKFKCPNTRISTLIIRIHKFSNEESKFVEKSLYERLGGVFGIAMVVDRFSDEVMKNQVAVPGSKNPDLKEWHTEKYKTRLMGLKWMRTLWVCTAAGGPFHYVGTKPGQTLMGLEKAHFDLHISPDEFDAVAAVLAHTLDYYKVPTKEKNEVLAAFAAHKGEVNQGYFAKK
jgi:hemoglobin